MGSILIPLGAFLASAVGPLAAKVLLSLGFGIVSGAAVVAATTSLTSLAVSKWQSIGGPLLSILQLAGAFDALAVVSAALAYRAAVSAIPKLGIVPTSGS